MSVSIPFTGFCFLVSWFVCCCNTSSIFFIAVFPPQQKTRPLSHPILRSGSSHSPPLCIPQQKSTDNTSRDADAADNRHAEQALLGDLVVDELAQVGGLEVGGLLVEEEVVVAAGLAVVSELVVAEGEVVEALAAALGGDAEDVGEEADAELLVVAVV